MYQFCACINHILGCGYILNSPSLLVYICCVLSVLVSFGLISFIYYENKHASFSMVNVIYFLNSCYWQNSSTLFNASSTPLKTYQRSKFGNFSVSVDTLESPKFGLKGKTARDDFVMSVYEAVIVSKCGGMLR